ncbi:MAG TPA: ABC transporter permease [Armatimonadota bacterium]
MKEFRQQLRDPQTLRMLAFAPIFQLVVLGYAVTNDPKDIRVACLDLDHTEASRQIQQDLAHVGYFIVHSAGSPAQLLRELDSGEAQATLEIPPGFARRLSRGEQSPVQLMTDGSDTNTATLAMSYIIGTVRDYSGDVQAKWRERRGGALGGAVEVSRAVWYNPALTSRDYVLPGVVALILATLASSLTVLSIAREREVGTLEQLMVTPLSTWEFMAGKTLPAAALAFANAWVVISISVLWFHVPFRGSIFFLLFAIVPFLMGTLGLGLLISSVAKTQQQAQLLNFFSNLPQSLLSGFIFPIATMPAWAQGVSAVIPQRYFLEIVRGVYLKGLGPETLWPQVLALFALAGALFAAGVASFRRRLD